MIVMINIITIIIIIIVISIIITRRQGTAKPAS